MPVAVTITPRKLYKEDMDLSTLPTGNATTATVLGPVGPAAQAVTKLDIVFLSAFTIADNDVAAAAGGVDLGMIYCTSAGVLRARMT